MILDQNKFFEIYKAFAVALEKSAADNTSSYSDILLMKLHPETLKTGKGCSLGLIALSFIGTNSHNDLVIREQIQKIASRRNFEGEWNTVKELLLTENIPFKMISKYLENRSSEDFFGNDFKLLKRIGRSVKFYNPYLQSKLPVKKPQRKRGYDDKGHLRDSSKARQEPRPFKEKIDIEPIVIAHNFLNKEYTERSNNAQGTLVEKSTSWLNSDLEGDTFHMRTSVPETNSEQRYLEQLLRSKDPADLEAQRHAWGIVSKLPKQKIN
jgi:hypothetical protein